MEALFATKGLKGDRGLQGPQGPKGDSGAVKLDITSEYSSSTTVDSGSNSDYADGMLNNPCATSIAIQITRLNRAGTILYSGNIGLRNMNDDAANIANIGDMSIIYPKQAFSYEIRFSKGAYTGKTITFYYRFICFVIP